MCGCLLASLAAVPFALRLAACGCLPLAGVALSLACPSALVVAFVASLRLLSSFPSLPRPFAPCRLAVVLGVLFGICALYGCRLSIALARVLTDTFRQC